jgi:hypothetical protein
MKIVRGFFLVMVCVLGAALPSACGPPRSSGPAPQTPASPPISSASDAGLPDPAPSSRHGVIVPGDTGMGAAPSGSAPATGTNGNAIGPTLGTPSGGN